MATICKSHAYQLSSRFEGEYKPEYDRYYARKLVRRLSAEEVYDAIAKSTGILGHGVDWQPHFPNRYWFPTWSGYAMDLPSPMNGSEFCSLDLKRFLFFFGRGDRSTKEPDTKTSIMQASLMMNSDLVREKILAKTKGSRVQTLLEKTPPWTWDKPDRPMKDEIVDELFLCTLSRYPTPEEKVASVDHIERYRDKGVEDLQWALINKPEMMVNY